MKPRPPHEPTRSFQRSRRLQDDATRNSRSLGCRGCPDFKHCGGLHTEAQVFDCSDLCSCTDRSRCDMICRNNPDLFFARVMEVDGFDLDTIRRVLPLPLPHLPEVVPLISHKFSRGRMLHEPVVAVPLYELFHMGSGEPLVSTREELSDRFRIRTDAVVVASGVNRDVKIEAWAAIADRPRVLATLQALGVALVTTPNFSLFVDVPRPDNLHGMKRIGLSWAELTAAGVPTALHINARTDHDYARWIRFVDERPEVAALAFEFSTGAGYSGRIDWHIEQLCGLADCVDRPLMLVVRGGVRALLKLRAHFSRVILIDTEPFSRAVKRRRAVLTDGGKLRWVRSHTPKGAPIDDLLAHNVATIRTARAIQLLPLRLPSPTRRPVVPRRPAQHANRQPGQASFMPELDMSLKTRAVPVNRKNIVVAAKS
jgi:Domain of unknown function (DUF4417)